MERLKVVTARWPARWGVPAIPVAAALLVFARGFFADGLVWDDRIIARWQSPFLKSFADAFFPPAGIPNLGSLYYRPLVLASYHLEALFAEPAQAAGLILAHAFNLLLHAFATILFYRFCLALFDDEGKKPALLAALLFAVHPVHAESVYFLAGRTDLLASVFVLASFLAAHAFREGRRPAYCVFSAVLFFLGLLSKEVAVAALGFLPFYWFFAPRKDRAGADWRGLAFLGGCWLLALFACFALRNYAGYPLGGNSFGAFHGEAFLPALGFAVGRVVFPWPQMLYPQTLPGVGLTAFWLAFALPPMALAARHKRARGVIVMACAWFVAFLVPALIIPLFRVTPNPMADRYLYLPSIAVCLLAGKFTAEAGRWKIAGRVALLLYLLVVVAFGVTSYSRASAWKNDLSFWTAVSGEDSATNDPVVVANLAIAQRDAGNYKAARNDAQRAMSLFLAALDKAKANLLLGSVDAYEAKEKVKDGDYEGALRLADDAIRQINLSAQRLGGASVQHRMTLGVAWYSRAEAKRLMGDRDRSGYEEALRNLDAALKILPYDHETLVLRKEVVAGMSK